MKWENIESWQLETLATAMRCEKYVSGHTHNFYRYPARFSPVFARGCIEAFSKPGDVILDPFAGGGTTLVEAMVSGRFAVGSDLNELACFVSRAKTTLLKPSELTELSKWGGRFLNSSVSPLDTEFLATAREDHVFTNALGSSTRPLLRYLLHGLSKTKSLSSPRAQNFARCFLLRLGQQAVDGRRFPENFKAIGKRAEQLLTVMISEAQLFATHVKKVRREHSLECVPRANIFCGDSSSLHTQPGISAITSPHLVVTSPPYPGVHVLYHRWQIGGRRETPLPFWIAGCNDGHGASFYTLGDRKETELGRYFRTLESCFSAIGTMLRPGTPLIQLVAFSEPEWQVPRYLEVMRNAGFSRIGSRSSKAKSLERRVPNRRWHALLKGETSGSREVVLFHFRD